MSLIRITAIAVAATILATAPGSAGPVGLSDPPPSSPDLQIVQIQGGEAITGAIIGGILGGATDNGCYLNDCGYGYGYGGAYGGGGYGGRGGGGRGHGGGGHGGGGHGGGGHGGGGHGGGGHGHR